MPITPSHIAISNLPRRVGNSVGETQQTVRRLSKSPRSTEPAVAKLGVRDPGSQPCSAIPAFSSREGDEEASINRFHAVDIGVFEQLFIVEVSDAGRIVVNGK